MLLGAAPRAQYRRCFAVHCVAEDENSVEYMSPRALERLVARLRLPARANASKRRLAALCRAQLRGDATASAAADGGKPGERLSFAGFMKVMSTLASDAFLASGAASASAVAQALARLLNEHLLPHASSGELLPARLTSVDVARFSRDPVVVRLLGDATAVVTGAGQFGGPLLHLYRALSHESAQGGRAVENKTGILPAGCIVCSSTRTPRGSTRGAATAASSRR